MYVIELIFILLCFCLGFGLGWIISNFAHEPIIHTPEEFDVEQGEDGHYYVIPIIKPTLH